MAPERKPNFYWDTVTFKVEDRLFRVPRDGLIQASEAFADMFSLPTGTDTGITEGRSDELPITLEGYKEEDFEALLKIIYPTPDDVMAGTFTLSKEEWISVLNLSTRWSMKKIRQYSILKLSSLGLSGIEKITLARAHSVLKWFQEGIDSIITAPVSPPLEDLHPLGLETACRILWIRDQCSSKLLTADSSHFTLNSLKCNKCYSSMFTTSLHCKSDSCHKVLRPHEHNAIFLDEETGTTVHYRTVEGAGNPIIGPYFTIELKNLSCGGQNTHCPLKPKTNTCPSCGATVGKDQFLLRPSVVLEPQGMPLLSGSLVEEVFKGEIEDLRMMEKD